MTLKLAAYMQPLTHRMYNAWFGETDPPSISQEEYDALHPEHVPENEKGCVEKFKIVFIIKRFNFKQEW